MNEQNGKFYKLEKDEDSMILPGDPQGLPDGFSKTIVFIDNASFHTTRAVLALQIELNFKFEFELRFEDIIIYYENSIL